MCECALYSSSRSGTIAHSREVEAGELLISFELYGPDEKDPSDHVVQAVGNRRPYSSLAARVSLKLNVRIIYIL